MASVTEALDQLVKAVDQAATRDEATGPAGPQRARDAIDDVLESPRRTTQVVSLAGSDVVEAFRRELADGFIRIDTVNQLLRLVSAVVERVVKA